MSRINFKTLADIMKQFDNPSQITITKEGEFPNESYSVDVYNIVDYPVPVAECVCSATFDAFSL